MEQLGDKGRLDGVEVFVRTDNLVFESCFYKGHSNSLKLNNLILRLRILEMRSGCLIRMIHIAGTRMKVWGIDGLSRGDLLEGVMVGKNLLEFVPLNE